MASMFTRNLPLALALEHLPCREFGRSCAREHGWSDRLDLGATGQGTSQGGRDKR